MLDTVLKLETPESIDLELTLAGPVVRILAFLVDLVIKFTIILIAGFALTFTAKVGEAMMLILLFFLEWLYPVLFEVLRYGQTPGKKVMGIKVIHENGTPIGWTSSMIRNLLRFVDFLPAAYITGLISMICNARFQRLGDLAAGSIVVYQREKKNPPPLQHVSPTPPPTQLTLDDQRAFVSFAERQAELSQERHQEIANTLTPLIHSKDQDAANKIIRIAHWLRGMR